MFVVVHLLQIYVIDSADPGRLEETRVELDELLEQDKLNGVPVLVFANKQDLDLALKPDEVSLFSGLSLLQYHDCTYTLYSKSIMTMVYIVHIL